VALPHPILKDILQTKKTGTSWYSFLDIGFSIGGEIKLNLIVTVVAYIRNN
jgi:hypothetical protein